MGHVARLIEEAGIPTVIVAVKAFETRMRMMTLPRVVLTPHLLGRPFGAPGDHATQRAVILTALKLLESAPREGEIANFQPERA